MRLNLIQVLLLLDSGRNYPSANFDDNFFVVCHLLKYEYTVHLKPILLGLTVHSYCYYQNKIQSDHKLKKKKLNTTKKVQNKNQVFTINLVYGFSANFSTSL